jgi:hypothetical protein
LSALYHHHRFLKTMPFHEFVTVSIRDDNALAKNDDLNEMKIVDCTPDKLLLFGKKGKPSTWGDLTDQVLDKNDDSWRTELRRALRAARGNKMPPDIHATYTDHDGKYYHPVLHAMVQVESTGEIHSYMIDFIEDIKVIGQTSLPDGLRVLAIVLRLAFHFRVIRVIILLRMLETVKS